MRRRYVMREGKLVELDLDAPLGPRRAPYVQTDISPYRSMRTGEIIGGRAQHREHLHQYGLIEVGNERLPPPKPAAPAAGEIAQDIKREIARDAGERRAMAETALRQSGYDGPAIERILKG